MWGKDKDESIYSRALEMGVIDDWLGPEQLADCEVLFLCTPLEVMKEVLEELLPQLRPGIVLSDVGSVKGPVMKLFQAMLPEGVPYIGGHPLAGSEKGGLLAADAFLFENAAYVLSPGKSCPQKALLSLAELIKAIGARVVIMSSGEHDSLVARISHVPHLMANVLMHQLRDEGDLSMAGGGLRDMTRIAASDASLWTNILLFNQPEVLAALHRTQQHVESFIQALKQQDREALAFLLEQAGERRRQMPRSRACLDEAADLVAVIPDRPGTLGLVATILGEAGINIHDIQIMSVRDEDEGTIRISVEPSQAQKALLLLNKRGITAWVRMI